MSNYFFYSPIRRYLSVSDGNEKTRLQKIKKKKKKKKKNRRPSAIPFSYGNENINQSSQYRLRTGPRISVQGTQGDVTNPIRIHLVMTSDSLFVGEPERWSSRSWSMKMYVLPFAISFVPHSRFFWLLRVRLALSGKKSNGGMRCVD